MINNENSILAVLMVRYWAGFKHDKIASLQTITDNNMEAGAGKFNKKLLPKDALKAIKHVVTQFKYYFNDNTLTYKALLGTRILPSKEFMTFQKQVIKAQDDLEKAVQEFSICYAAHKTAAQSMLGSLYNDKDYPEISELREKFKITVNYFPVPEPQRFNDSVSSTQVDKLTAQINEMSLDAKYDLVNRTEKIARTLMDTLENDNKRIFYSTVVVNIDKLSNQLEMLNYDNDPLIMELKNVVDNNIVGIRMDYLRDSISYRGKVKAGAQKVIDIVDEINEAASDC
jgi:hypothetical protein